MSFNRTIVELKLELPPDIRYIHITFNRTIVELKLRCHIESNMINSLLIEPLWN